MKMTPKHTLTFYNYKEPLQKVKNGFGYYGTVAGTTDGKYVQCHLCGQLFEDLNFHVWCKHSIKAKEYKEMFQLAYSTALISEEKRSLLKQKTLDWIKTLTPKQKEAYRRKALEGMKKKGFDRDQPKIRLETKNKRGTCPDQLLAKITAVSEKIGHTPSLAEFIDVCGTQRYKHLIFATFGSWKKALEMVGKTPNPATVKHVHAGKRIKTGNLGGKVYEDEELLEYLSIFMETHHKVPTSTDCKRGLLPSEYCYKRFGGLVKARELAGLDLPKKRKGYRGGFEQIEHE